MNNSKLTNILLVLLLIFNVAFIGKWWMSSSKFHHPRKEVKDETTSLLHDRNKGEMFLVKSLSLDTLQQKKLDNILAAHYAFFDKYSNAYLRNQSGFFNALKNTPDSATAFRCADSLAILKIAMQKELYFHFLSIRNICNSGQQKQYNQLIDNMSREFVRHHNLVVGNNPDTNRDSL